MEVWKYCTVDIMSLITTNYEMNFDRLPKGTLLLYQWVLNFIFLIRKKALDTGIFLYNE